MTHVALKILSRIASLKGSRVEACGMCDAEYAFRGRSANLTEMRWHQARNSSVHLD